MPPPLRYHYAAAATADTPLRCLPDAIRYAAAFCATMILLPFSLLRFIVAANMMRDG